MKIHLHWKVVATTTLPVIVAITATVWLVFDQLAADYFMVLMDKYMVSPTETHRAFLTAVHRYLLWASLVALVLSFFLSYLLTKRVLRPLVEINAASRKIADGDFSQRVAVSGRDEISDLGQAFNRMTSSLEDLEQLRKSMVSDVAHELRTPLTNLRGYLEGLSDGVILPDKAVFGMLQQENLRLVKLVDDLGQLARADAARVYLNRQTVSLSECVSEIINLYRGNIDENNIQVITHFAKDVPNVFVDRDKLLQAFRNLLDNCLKFSPKGGTITISSKLENGSVRIDFVNNGPCIPEKEIPFIFERFYRAEFSRSREVGGAGIGLAIVKQLIEAHGGNVGAESSQDRTLIWIKLPL